MTKESAGDWLNTTNATSLFTFALGFVAGALYAVAIGQADPGGDYLRVFLTVMTALFGAALGLVVSRTMDRIATRRGSRRKLNSARVRILMLEFALERLRTDILAHFEKPERGTPPLSGPLIDVAHIAADPPDLNDILERDEDVHIQVSVFSTFRRVAGLISKGDMSPEYAKKLQLVATHVANEKGIGWTTDEIARLQNARAYIDAVIRTLT